MVSTETVAFMVLYKKIAAFVLDSLEHYEYC